jgi:YHS domain-containing protein
MRFLIWLVVLFWTIAVLRRVAVWMLRGFINSLARRQSIPADQQQSAVSSHRLVRDPICGVHLPEDKAITLGVQGEVVHFCSVKCRDQYTASQQKFAANG